MSLDAYLRARDDRCHHGYAAVQHPDLCACPGVRRRDRALVAVTGSAKDTDRARIDAAIRQVAGRGRPFSANDVRGLVPDAPGPLMGARFNAAAKAGVIRRVGYVASTKANTHAHPVGEWQAVS